MFSTLQRVKWNFIMINFFEILKRNGFNDNSSAATQIKRRIKKSQQMTADGYSLWGQLTTDTAFGVVQSQSSENKFYLTFIRADGSYGCFDNNFESCLGQPLYLPKRKRRRRRNYYRDQDDYDEEKFMGYLYLIKDNLGNEDFDPDFNDDEEEEDEEYVPPVVRRNSGTTVQRWDCGKPCKHVFSLLNGFCLQGDDKIQEILTQWITSAIKDNLVPTQDRSIAKFIQERFNPIKDHVLEKDIFKPLIQTKNRTYSKYKPSNRVKILDTEDTVQNTQLEFHLKVRGDKVKPLPLKNIICISCLKREQDLDKLKAWGVCRHCLIQICDSCRQILIQGTNGSTTCPSVLNGYKKHNLAIIDFFHSESSSKKKKTTSKAINRNKKGIIIEFGDK